MLELLLVLVLPLVLCAVFARNHVFAATIYLCMVLLSHFNMTVMLFTGSHALLIASASLFFVLFVIEKRWKETKTPTAKTMLNILAIVRYPVNFIYLGDIVFRLQNWGPIDNIPSGQPSLGAAVGSMLVLPLAITLIASGLLLVLYVVRVAKR